MIFVTVGTHEIPFARMLAAVGALVEIDELVVQRGSATISLPGARVVDFLPFAELHGLMREAAVVVTHAGAGSVISALSVDKCPVVVPRLQRFGETVDDHQLSFGRKLAAAGLVTCVEDLERLPDAVRGVTEGHAADVRPDPRLIDELRSEIDDALLARAGRRPRAALVSGR